METEVVKVSNLVDSSKPKYIANSLNTGTDPLDPNLVIQTSDCTEYEFQVAAQSVHGCGPFSELISGNGEYDIYSFSVWSWTVDSLLL